jgi:enoyl-CoA hydratase
VTEPATELVHYRRAGAVAHLVLDHPPVNVLSTEVLQALGAAFDRAESDAEARVVVLESAAAKAFAAGADIRSMAAMGPTEAKVHGRRGQAAAERIERSPLPAIAAVHGSCLGGGTELVLACDFVIASDDALFGQPEIKLGVMPGWGGTQRLPRRIGTARAREWIMTGRSVPAAEAEREGLVLQVVPRAELAAAADRLAAELARQPATALAAAKYALQRAIDRGSEAGMTLELDLWHRLFATPDQKEGMRAFLEKRPMTLAPRRPQQEEKVGFPWEPKDPTGK